MLVLPSLKKPDELAGKGVVASWGAFWWAFWHPGRVFPSQSRARKLQTIVQLEVKSIQIKSIQEYLLVLQETLNMLKHINTYASIQGSDIHHIHTLAGKTNN